MKLFCGGGRHTVKEKNRFSVNKPRAAWWELLWYYEAENMRRLGEAIAAAIHLFVA